MDNDELLEAILAELDPLPRAADPQVTGGPVGPTQRLRTMAQGLTLGGADEIEAAIRALSPAETYDEALADTRGKVEQYRRNNPSRALGDEMMGALAPAAAGVMTGGAASGLTMGRLAATAGIGAGEGAAYSFLSGTGGDAEDYWGQALNRSDGVLMGAGIGAAAGPLGLAAGSGARKVIGGIIDYANRTLGPRAGKAVEREMLRVIEESELTPEEAARKIESGELLAEANKTLQTVARSYYAKNTGAAQILSNTFERRPNELRRDTMDYLQQNMAGEGDPNVLRKFQADDDALRQQKGADYNRAFAAAGAVSDEAAAQIGEAFKRAPGAAQELDVMFRAKTGRKPFFTVEKDGSVSMTRKPTVEEAEIFYRGLRDYSQTLYHKGAGGAGGAVKDVALGVRGIVDEASPDVARVRADWAQLETAKDAFGEGRKALSKSPDEVAIAFEEASQKGDAVLKAYRAGVMDAYRRKATTGSNKSLPGNMANEERKEGAILRIVFPEDNLEEMLGRASRAGNSHEAAKTILGGSPTSVTEGRKKQIGGSLVEDAMSAAGGSPIAALRIAGQVAKSLRSDLSPKDIQQVAKLMVESDPEVFRRAIMGTGTSDALVRVGENVLRRIEKQSSKGTRRAIQPAYQNPQGLLDSFQP